MKSIFKRYKDLYIFILFIVLSIPCRSERHNDFTVKAQHTPTPQRLSLRTDMLPWVCAIPNLGAELKIGEKWSAVIDLWYCPWKISQKFSIKTIGFFPEGRWWIKSNKRGSFLNIHLDLAWFNVRANRYRYQDISRPLLGAGIGYGYRWNIGARWGLELEIGAGVANMKYDRFYNLPNGALKDTRVSTYFGIDRASFSLSYYLCDI